VTESESPGALAALGASGIDRLGRQVISKTNRQQQLLQAPIYAAVLGPDRRYSAEGISARRHARVHLGLRSRAEQVAANGVGCGL
jgi:hypothetical protein